MKKLALMVVGGFLAFQTTSALAQTVKQTKTNKSTVNQTGSARTTVTTQSATKPNATQEYSTAPVSGITNYKAQADAPQNQGASAENGEEAVTIIQKDLGEKSNTPATTTKSTYKKTTMPAGTASKQTTAKAKVVKN